MMDYPGWIGDGAQLAMPIDEPFYFNHEEVYKQHGPITKIVIHSGDRIDGIELFYGKHAAPVRGSKVTGNRHESMKLKPNEMLTGLYANARQKEPIAKLKFVATTEDGKFGQALDGGQGVSVGRGWDYSFNGHEGGLRGETTKRLLWFCGWSLAKDGFGGGFIFRLLPVFGHYQTWGPLK